MQKKKLIRISTVPGSLEIFLHGQLNMLSGYFDVLAVSSPGAELEIIKEREKVRVAAVPMKRHISIFYDLISLLRLIILFARERPDIVHSITPKAGLLAMIAARITCVPVRVHTFTGLVFPTTTGMMRKLLITMDHVICYCATYFNPEGEGVKRDLLRFHITSRPLHVIANGNVRGIDPDYYDRTPEVMEKARKLQSKDLFTFCFIGRLVRDKGINELIVAFTDLYKQKDNIRLILAGTFEEELDPLLPETIKQIKQHPGILYMGQQSDVRPFFAASDIFVFPSYREGFPNVVLEAGAMGLPAIVTDINGSNEIIIPDENGVIIPPRDQEMLYNMMRSFVEQPEMVKYMAANARRLIVSRYERKMIWDALLREYQILIK